MDFSNVNNVLVIKLRHIGDVLLTVPVFRALRETFPDARLSALVNAGTEQMLTEHPLICEVIGLNKKQEDIGRYARIKKQVDFIRDLRAHKFDMTIDLTGGDRAAIISFLSGARYRIGWKPKKGFAGKKKFYTHLSRPEPGTHTVLQNLQVLEPFGMTTNEPVVDFYVSEQVRQNVERLLVASGCDVNSSIIHIHPASRWLFKCWNDKAMAEVMAQLVSRGYTVVVTCSPVKNEMAKTANILDCLASTDERARRKIIDLSGQTTLKELAVVSEKAKLFFGVDSAPMHMAAAVGTPVVALFGPSGVFNWGPWPNTYRTSDLSLSPYPDRNGVQTSGQHTVIQRAWECVPCGKDGCDGTKVSQCLEDISVDEVLSLLLERLSSF